MLPLAAGFYYDPIKALIDFGDSRDIDTAIAQVLGLPDFSVLRDLLAQEPVVCLKPLS